MILLNRLKSSVIKKYFYIFNRFWLLSLVFNLLNVSLNPLNVYLTVSKRKRLSTLGVVCTLTLSINTFFFDADLCNKSLPLRIICKRLSLKKHCRIQKDKPYIGDSNTPKKPFLKSKTNLQTPSSA